MQDLKFLLRRDGNGKNSGSCCSPDSGCDPSPALLQSTRYQEEKKDLRHWILGTVTTPVGTALKVSSEWSPADYWGMIKSRVGAFRMNYAVAPGLYAVGEPAKDSNVFVTANYKLTFDILRRELKDMNAWILVLDTKSINVWCAAGKGTFGTAELINRIAATKLNAVVSHRRLILPQLGAVGVNAAEVQKRIGFRVSFGPVRAKDIPAYIKAGYKKTRDMNTIAFPMLDRLILTPMELGPALKKFPWFAGAVLLIFGLEPQGILFAKAWTGGAPLLLLGLISILAGAFLMPVLLPFVPFRSFAIKGWIVGMLSVLLADQVFGLVESNNTIMRVATYLFFPAASSYIALQFTGSTTFTGMSGVKKELKISIPVYIITVSVSLILIALFKLKAWRIV